MTSFSVIIPAYSGTETIAQTLSSINNQPTSSEFEVIIVQDGPNSLIEEAIKNSLKSTPPKYNLVYKKLSSNRGRFNARLIGAKLANKNYLLFIDDRVSLDASFFNILNQFKEKLLIGNVIEKTAASTNLISTTLFYIRNFIYGSSFGTDFDDYYIDKSNFETSPKGTASLFISKKLFLSACEALKRKADDTGHSLSDDTRLLKIIVDSGNRILRTSRLKIYYQPRSDFGQAMRHLYSRGPKFVDYYSRPKSKFFPVLMGFYLLFICLILMLVLEGKHIVNVAAVLVVLDLVAASIIGKKLAVIARLVVGLPVVSVIFAAGIIKGTLIKAHLSAKGLVGS